MIKQLEKNTKQYFLDKFKNSKHLEDVKKIKSDKLVLIIMPQDELKTFQQNKAVHALIGELYKSGLSSFNDYNECRDFFKEKAGLISYDKAFLNPVMESIQRKVYHMLPTDSLKLQHKQTILEGQRVVRSVSDATKEELILMINEVIKYCYDVGLNTDNFNIIMKGLDNGENNQG